MEVVVVVVAAMVVVVLVVVVGESRVILDLTCGSLWI